MLVEFTKCLVWYKKYLDYFSSRIQRKAAIEQLGYFLHIYKFVFIPIN